MTCPFHSTTVSRICGGPITPTKRSERSFKLRTLERRCFIAAATQNAATRRMPFTKMTSNADIFACNTTLEAAFNKEGYNRRVSCKKIFLDKQKKRLRLEWALERQHWTIEKLRNVIWTDERYVWLSGSGGRIWVTRKPGEALKEDCLVPRFAKSSTVMIWEAIYGVNGGSKLPLVL